MRGRIFVLLTFVIVIIGVIAGVGYEFGKRESIKNITNQEDFLAKPQKDIKLSNEDLFYKMAKETKAEFVYPVSELMMKYEFKADAPEPLRIFVGDLNEYRFYCLNQVLSENEVEYAYYRTGDVIQLIVFLNDEEKQKKIFKDFAYYKITYEIQKDISKFESNG